MSAASVRTVDTYRRPRRRGLRALIALVVVVLLLVAGVVVAEVLTRQRVQDAVAEKVRTALSLPASAPVDVELGGFSVLQQLAQGRLERVAIATPAVSIGGITGALSGTALGVPTDQNSTVRHLALDFGVREDQLAKLAKNVSGVPVTKISITPPDLAVQASVSVLGAAIPVTVAVTPSVVNGQLAFTPTSASVFGATLSAGDLRQRFGAAARSALETRDFCIATSLPKALAVSTLSVKTHEIVLGLVAADVQLSDQTLAVKGSCPAN